MHGLNPLIRKELSGNNKTAIVFGSNGSIGSAIADHLRKNGVRTVGIGRSQNTHPSNTYYQCDLRNEKEITELSKIIAKDLGSFHYLILSQGTQLRKPLLDVSKTEWDDIINTNLTSNFLICKYFFPQLVKQNFGRVVGISSLTSRIGIRNIAPYAASKGGMEQLLKTLAVELSEYDITVNTINPGRISTNMTNDLTSNTDSSSSIISRIPKGRFGKPGDILSAIDFLLSDSSSYITGQSIIIDGGWMGSGGNPRT
ncbi:MAG: SDR family oxidoreductase [Bacteroidetes bacterium]|nr:MAG: SDR family oxidoreductase [Bacteroidota bacterium]